MANTPNLSLGISIPGTTPGPQWATTLEANNLIIDSHTHVSGQGIAVPTAGVNINATLPFNTFGASSVGTIGLTSQSTTASGTGSIFYNKSGNVYWNNASGVPIQLTTGNSINVASVGGITGLGGTTGAFTYSDALKAFIATADTAKSAAIDAGAYTVRETNVANAKGVTIKSPTSLLSDYNLTVPSGLPVTASGLLTMNSTGGMAVIAVGGAGVQVGYALTTTQAQTSGSTVFDTGAPVSNTGDLYLTQAYTAQRALNRIRVRVVANLLFGSVPVAGSVISGGIFKDGALVTAANFYTALDNAGTKQPRFMAVIEYNAVAGDLSSHTWTFRAGRDTAATTTMNQATAYSTSLIEVTEISN